MDLNQLMQMAEQLKTQMQQAQDKAGEITVQGEAGGGLVKATMNGRHELVGLKIDPSAIKAGDLSFLEDMICAAVNQACSKVGHSLKDQLGHVAKDLGVDMSALEKLGFK